MNVSVPVLYYHRVGAPDKIHLSIPNALFEKQMAFLERHGWHTLNMRGLFDHITGASPAPSKSVAITFDDGFRDVLTNALPILKRHGFRATVFASVSLVRPESQPPVQAPRPFTQAQTVAILGDCGDFLSFSELEELAKAGIETHSHGWRHAQAIREPKITGFYPEDDNHWGILTVWNPLPKMKKLPVFPRASAFVTCAYNPISEKFEANDGKFKKGEILDERWFEIETEEMRERRIKDELVSSRSFFSLLHEQNCDVFCWPWGVHDAVSRKAAAEAGYAGALAVSTGANIAGTDKFAVHRFPVKKNSLLNFVVGLLLRSCPVSASVYGKVRGRL